MNYLERAKKYVELHGEKDALDRRMTDLRNQISVNQSAIETIEKELGESVGRNLAERVWIAGDRVVAVTFRDDKPPFIRVIEPNRS